ncbi:MAG: ABC transporter ATP-binding protein, partial [Pedobacter sp.]|uniref:ABC transporter ATP-binding protein n=1 Tax=Pedobacter sp. TaxID=1411316 RepID=UPI003398405A
MGQPILQTTDLTIGYHTRSNQSKTIAGPLNLSLYPGEMICVLGPNGCGKSTLLRTVAGLQNPVSGTVRLSEKNMAQLKPEELARQISLVLTDSVRNGNLDVYTVIALGRYPYSGWLGILSGADKAAIAHAVQVTGTSDFLSRKIDSLSDGECQKVMLARAMAQDTPLIILDEPTAHLDLPSRIQLMRLLHKLAKENHKAILISTHELDLALQVADQIWLMDSTGHLAAGLPEELVLDGSFQRAFDKDGISFDTATGTFPVHDTGKETLTLRAEGAAAFWTRKALTRKGYVVSMDDQLQSNVVTIVETRGITQWTIEKQGQ